METRAGKEKKKTTQRCGARGDRHNIICHQTASAFPTFKTKIKKNHATCDDFLHFSVSMKVTKMYEGLAQAHVGVYASVIHGVDHVQ